MQKRIIDKYFNREKYCVFHDELGPRKANNREWLYHGILFIPYFRKEKCYDELFYDRKDVGYSKELHFMDIKGVGTERFKLSKKWMDLFFKNWYQFSKIYILGVCCSNLKKSSFGQGKERQYRIYNKFFKTCFKGALRFCFQEKNRVDIIRIFSEHKEGRQKGDNFKKYPIEQLIQELPTEEEKYPDISFSTNEIEFVKSNHEKEPVNKKASHFIQFVDNILGATFEALEVPSKNKAKLKLGFYIAPFVEDALRVAYEKKHKVYHKVFCISFCPKKKRNLLIKYGDSFEFYDCGAKQVLIFNIKQLNLGL